MWIAFTRPLYLLLLPPVAALLYYGARRSFAGWRGARKWVAWGIRGTLLLSLILALAGMQIVRRATQQVVVYALDNSSSIAPGEEQRALDFIRQSLPYRRAQDRGVLVMFAREASVESENLRRPEDVNVTSRTAPAYTNLASGLRLALGLAPPEAACKVVLFSDGNENVGSAANEALLAQARGVLVEVVPLQTRAVQDTMVREVRAPTEARRGEPFPLRLYLQATAPTTTTATILVDDRPVERRSLTLPAGTSTLTVPATLVEPGFHKVDVVLEGGADDCRDNDRGTAFVRVRGKPRVLLVDPDPRQVETLRRVLQLQDVDVQVGGRVRLPLTMADLEAYDSLFLSNLPAYQMAPEQLGMIRDATRDQGIGLGMIGGENSFGAGGYYQTPVEEALPVTMDMKKHRVFPATAVLIIIDTSGSMGMVEDGVEKIQLAAEAACAVVDLLQPYDMVGVMISDPSPTLAAKVGKLDNKGAVTNAIRGIRAGGGGIYVTPCMQLGFDLMRNVDAPVRHVIMLADGSDCDEPEGGVALAQAMAAAKITCTTISFGDGPDRPFLEQVAKAGRGQFYLTERGRDLKKIFTRETMLMARSVLVEERFSARPAAQSPITAGLDWGAAPPLLGYVATSGKDLATMALVTHRDDPLLAHWQYGLGHSVAYTSDAKAHWAAGWLRWGGFGQLWSQMVRWSLRETASGSLFPRIEQQGEQAKLIVQALNGQAEPINGLDLQARVNAPDGSRLQSGLSQTAPGRYEGTVPTVATGSYVVSLSATGPGGFSAQESLGFALAYPPDLADTQPNPGLLTSLAEQTGGRTLTKPEEVFAPPTVTPKLRLDIWHALLWLAALLLPLDVAVRRLVITRQDLVAWAAALALLRAKLRGRRRQRETVREAGMERLLRRKQTTERRMAPPPPVGVDFARPRAMSTRPIASNDPPPSPPAPVREPSPPVPGEDTTARLLRLKRERRGDPADGDQP